jgi:SlyX protein
MSNEEFSRRIEMLESRLMHREATLEELTHTLLTQEERIREQSETIKRLREQLRTSLPSPVALPEEETPPPHY